MIQRDVPDIIVVRTAAYREGGITSHRKSTVAFDKYLVVGAGEVYGNAIIQGGMYTGS